MPPATHALVRLESCCSHFDRVLAVGSEEEMVLAAQEYEQQATANDEDDLYVVTTTRIRGTDAD